jgi:hypothetical protein
MKGFCGPVWGSPWFFMEGNVCTTGCLCLRIQYIAIHCKGFPRCFGCCSCETWCGTHASEWMDLWPTTEVFHQEIYRHISLNEQTKHGVGRNKLRFNDQLITLLNHSQYHQPRSFFKASNAGQISARSRWWVARCGKAYGSFRGN